MNRFHRPKICNLSVSFQIVIVMILLVIPLNIWSVFTVSSMKNYIYAESRNSIYSVGNQMMGNLDNRIKEINYYLYDALQNNSFFRMVENRKKDAEFYHALYNLFYDINDHIVLSHDADAYFIYEKEKDSFFIAKTYDWNFNQFSVEKYLRKNILTETEAVISDWHLVEYEQRNWLLRCRENEAICYGAIIDITHICEEISKDLGSQSTSLVMKDTSAQNIKKMRKEMESLGKRIRNTDTAKTVGTTCFSEQLNIYLDISTEKTELIHNLPFWDRIGSGISICLCLSLPLIICFLYRVLIRPINVLLSAMEYVRTGDWDYEIREPATSIEFCKVYATFNDMLRAQRKTSHELIEKETYSHKLEFQNLQMQIRPHFLLNSFKLLYGLVSLNKTESSQKMILFLSEYFRYLSSNNNEMETYERELSMIEQYMEVAKLRYPFVAFEETHDEEILKFCIPGLLIHNFIENVLKHGIRPECVTHIKLEAKYEDFCGIFRIVDDGHGMKQEIVELINRGEFENELLKTHIGIRNSWQRIHFYYGDEARLHVESGKNRGTVIVIKLPGKLEKYEIANTR